MLAVSLLEVSKINAQRSISEKHTQVGRNDRRWMRHHEAGRVWKMVGARIDGSPSRSEYVDAFQPLHTVHLCKHLIHNPICNPSAVMSPEKIDK